MSSTSNYRLGDPSHGGALFLLPREVRDEIYRLLVKGRYLAEKPLNEYDNSNSKDTDGRDINNENIGNEDVDNEHIDSETIGNENSGNEDADGQPTNDKNINDEDTNEEETDGEEEFSKNDGPEFSILRVSKVLSHEAKKVLYSDSVFRFVIDFPHPTDDEKVRAKIYGLKEVAPMMKNFDLDFDCRCIDFAEWFYTRGCFHHAKTLERSFGPTIDLFRDPKIMRRSLQVRFLSSSTSLALWSTPSSIMFLDPPNTFPLRKTSFSAICQRLNALVAFRTATVEIMLTPDSLEKPGYYGFDVTEPSRSTRDLVRRITTAVQEQLEPTFVFAISSFKSNSRNMPVPDDTSLVGYLKFRPGQNPVMESSAQTTYDSKACEGKLVELAKTRLHGRHRSV